MAKTNGNGSVDKGLVAEWAKAQARVEKAQEELKAAQDDAGSYARRIYEGLGSKPFTVKALNGRGYRAIHKPERKAKDSDRMIPASYHVIPLPDNAPQAEF